MVHFILSNQMKTVNITLSYCMELARASNLGCPNSEYITCDRWVFKYHLSQQTLDPELNPKINPFRKQRWLTWEIKCKYGCLKNKSRFLSSSHLQNKHIHYRKYYLGSWSLINKVPPEQQLYGNYWRHEFEFPISTAKLLNARENLVYILKTLFTQSAYT